MYNQILKRMQECIRTRRYVMTVHAEEEVADDGLTIYDIESAVLCGTINHRQKDFNTKEWKYVVQGKAIAGDIIIIVGKLGFTGKLIIITVYRE